MRVLPAFAAVLCCIGAVPRAHADIFSYIDDQGVSHYSNVPTDQRYTLLLRSPPEPQALSQAAPPSGGWHQRAASYAGLIDRAARTAAVQPALLRAVIAVESAFDTKAVSRAGAQGLMQLHPTTARRYGVGNAFDPEQNLRGGASYLSDLLRRYDNDLELVLAAYNAGEDAVERYGRHIPPYRETRAYVPAVLKLYKRFLAQAI